MKHAHTVVFLALQGVPHLLTERDLSDAPAPWGSRAFLRCLTGGVDISPRQLDRIAHRVTGGGFTFNTVDHQGTVSDVFRPRQTMTATLLSGVTATATPTTLSLSNTSGFPSAGSLFIGLECFNYTGKTSTTVTGVTRAQYGSRAQQHQAGTPVWPYVRTLRGRRVTVYSWDRVTDTVTTLAVGTLDRTPTVTERHRWTWDARAVEDDIAARQYAVGLKPAQFTEGTATAGTLTVVDSDAYLFPAAGGYFCKLVPKADDSAALLFAVDSASSGTLTLGNQLDAVAYGKDRKLWDTNSATDTAVRVQAAALLTQQNTLTSVQPILYASGDPAVIVLSILLSRYGDGTGGDFDVFVGTEPTAGFSFDGFRLGAGFYSDEVDADAFLAWVGASPFPWTVYADAPASVGELLTELCLVLGAFWYVTADGVLTVRRLPLAVYDTDGTTLTISASDRTQASADTVEVDDVGTPARVSFAAGVNLLTGDEDLTLTVTDVRIPPDDVGDLNFSLRFTDVDAGAALPTPRIKRASVSLTHLQVIAQRFMSPFVPPDLLVTALVHTRLAVGDVVAYNHTGMTDMSGGDLSDVVAVVDSVSWSADDHTGDAILRVVQRGRVIAPSAPITAVSTTVDTDDTVTLATSDDSYDDTPPAHQFGVGWHLVAYDDSAGIAYSHTVAEVIDGTHLRLNDALGFTPSTGDWLTLAAYPVSILDSSANGRDIPLNTDAFMFLADSGENLGAADAPHRWTA